MHLISILSNHHRSHNKWNEQNENTEVFPSSSFYIYPYLQFNEISFWIAAATLDLDKWLVVDFAHICQVVF